jgi:tetratricopeptide (TPR) repeat protein
VPHFEAALRLWPAERGDAELACLLVDFAAASQFGSDVETAYELAERALPLAERLGDPVLLARALSTVTSHRSERDPRPQIAIQSLERAAALARQAGDWRTLQALAVRRGAVDAAERAGETERVALACQAVAYTCYLLGDWEAGRAAARAGLALDPLPTLQAWRIWPGWRGAPRRRWCTSASSWPMRGAKVTCRACR